MVSFNVLKHVTAHCYMFSGNPENVFCWSVEGYPSVLTRMESLYIMGRQARGALRKGGGFKKRRGVLYRIKSGLARDSLVKLLHFGKN